LRFKTRHGDVPHNFIVRLISYSLRALPLELFTKPPQYGQVLECVRMRQYMTAVEIGA